MRPTGARRREGPPPSVATVRLPAETQPTLRRVELQYQIHLPAPKARRSRIPLPRYRHSKEGMLAGSGGIPKPPGAAILLFWNGAPSRGRRCFADHFGRTGPGTRPSAREPGKLRPDVSQFVDAEPTGSDRQLERRSNPPLRSERINTAMGVCLREPGRKTETEPSVTYIIGTLVVLAALRLRTRFGIHQVRHRIKRKTCELCKRLFSRVYDCLLVGWGGSGQVHIVRVLLRL